MNVIIEFKKVLMVLLVLDVLAPVAGNCRAFNCHAKINKMRKRKLKFLGCQRHLRQTRVSGWAFSC
jgi:hypothetical protein